MHKSIETRSKDNLSGKNVATISRDGRKEIIHKDGDKITFAHRYDSIAELSSGRRIAYVMTCIDSNGSSGHLLVICKGSLNIVMLNGNTIRFGISLDVMVLDVSI